MGERYERNEHTVQRCGSAEEDGKKKQKKKGSEVQVMTDVMFPFSSATRHPLYASGVFICLFDILPSPSTIWINVSLYTVHLILSFFLPSPPSVRAVLSCFRCRVLCIYICEKLPKSFPSTSLSPVSLFSPFPCHLYPFFSLRQRLDVVTPHSLSFSLSRSLHSIFFLC